MFKEIRPANTSKIRIITIGFDPTSKNYITEANAIRAAEQHAATMIGVANVRIAPFEGRFYPVFYCFSEEQDVFTTALRGFNTHR